MKSEIKRERDVSLLVYSKVTRHLKHCVYVCVYVIFGDPRTFVPSLLDRNIPHMWLK